MPKMNRAISTLDDTVKSYGKDDVLYIGSQSGFFFIGDKTEYEKRIDDISSKYETALASRLSAAQKDFENMTDKLLYLKKAESETIIEYADRVQRTGKEYKRLHSLLPKIKEEKENFTALRTREVKDSYSKEVEGGFAIIIEGNEIGGYWMKSEWDAEHNE